MVLIVASEIKKMQFYGYTKFLEPKRLREAVKVALKEVSIYKRYSVLAVFFSEIIKKAGI